VRYYAIKLNGRIAGGRIITRREGKVQMNWRLAAVALCVGLACWSMNSRAADDVPNPCGPDEELDGKVCYPKCKDDGYTRFEGDGDECWQICPSNSQDYGHVCLMGPAQLKKKMFKRGPGRALTG